MRAGPTKKKAQAAIDFITSYGFVLLFLVIVVYVVFRLGVFGNPPSAAYCFAYQPMGCVAYSINSTGALIVSLSQSSGGTMNITGIACASVQNAISIGPAYGNINALPYKATAINGNSPYYPNAQTQNGVVIYSGSSAQLSVNCYNAGGKASSSLGNTFTGYVWVNYTLSDLPSTHHNLQLAFTINVKYA